MKIHLVKNLNKIILYLLIVVFLVLALQYAMAFFLEKVKKIKKKKKKRINRTNSEKTKKKLEKKIKN